MLVMGGAIAVGFFAFRLAARRTETLFGAPLSLPQPGRIDRRLLVGSVLFGIGWGLAGICPGRGGPARYRTSGRRRVRAGLARRHGRVRALAGGASAKFIR